MKINILGFSGCGKSTLAEKLSNLYHLPVIYLDTVFWLPGWKMRDREEQTAILQKFLDENKDGWVIDGNYSRNLFDVRMEEADRIIFLNYNRFLCLWRIMKRRITFHKKSRPSMTEGCEEKVDLPFLKWAFWDSRTKASREKMRLLREQYPDKFVKLNTPRALEKYLEANLPGTNE